MKENLLKKLEELGVPIDGISHLPESDLTLLIEHAEKHGVPEGLTTWQVIATLQYLPL